MVTQRQKVVTQTLFAIPVNRPLVTQVTQLVTQKTICDTTERNVNQLFNLTGNAGNAKKTNIYKSRKKHKKG